MKAPPQIYWVSRLEREWCRACNRVILEGLSVGRYYCDARCALTHRPDDERLQAMAADEEVAERKWRREQATRDAWNRIAYALERAAREQIAHTRAMSPYEPDRAALEDRREWDAMAQESGRLNRRAG